MWQTASAWSKTLVDDDTNESSAHVRGHVKSGDATDYTGASTIRIKFTAHSSTSGTLDLVYFGEKDGAGWDIKSSPAKVKITFGGSDSSGAFTGDKWSDWVVFAFDGTKDYIVSMDYGSMADNARVSSTTGHKIWSTTNGAAADAAPGGGTEKNTIALAAGIELYITGPGGIGISNPGMY